MEARHRATGDGDKQEREQVTGPYRASAIDKFGQRRHGQRRAHNQNAYRQTDDSPDFQEGREVVTRSQQQPYGQHRRHKTVTHQHPGQLHAGKVKVRCPGRTFCHPAARDNGENQEYQTDDRHFANTPRTQIAQVDPHKQRQRNGERNGICSPRAMSQGFHHDHRQHCKDNDHDHKAGHQRNHPGGWPHLFFDQLTQRATVTARRNKQHHEILHRTGENHPSEQPDHPRQVAHLRRQYRPHQRTCSGNGRKMVTEQHFLVRRHIVQPVVMAHRWRHTRRVNRQHIFGDIQPIKTVSDQIDTDRRHHNPQRVDLFPTI